MKNFRIRKGDKVMIIAGKDNGKIGKVLKLLPKHDSVVVEKANMVKRHMRAARRHRGERDAHPHFQCDGCLLRLRQTDPRRLQVRGS